MKKNKLTLDQKLQIAIDALDSISGIDLGTKELIKERYSDATKSECMKATINDTLLARKALKEIQG